MCTELFLAIIYFITIFIVNFFLYKLLKNYILNILYLLKIKNISKFYPKEKLFLISNFYLSTKKNLSYDLLSKLMNKVPNYKDVLLIGNIYKFFTLKEISNGSSKNKNMNYYIKLLELQYLSNENNI